MTGTGDGSSRKHVAVRLLLAVLAIGLVFRLIACVVFPVVHDEVNVVGYGLTRAFMADSMDSLLFEVPASVSNGITPLWFWLQSLPASIFGVTSKAGLRLLPLLLGLIGVALAFRAGHRLFNARAAWFTGLLFGVMSLMLYTNSRGEFAASLFIPVLLLLLLDLQPADEGAPIPLRAALWPAIILFAYFGYGLPVWGAYALYLVLAWLLGRLGRMPAGRLGLGRLAALILLPLLPSVAWMLAAQATLFEPGTRLLTDIGPVSSIWESVRKLTIGYGTEVKSFMVSGWMDALYIFRDFRIWPTLCLLAVPTAAALLLLTHRVLRSCLSREKVEAEKALIPLCLAAPILLMLLVKGALGARFHLLYLPVLLPYAAAVLDGWLRCLEQGRWIVFLAGGSTGWVYVALWEAWAGPQEARYDWSQFAWMAPTGIACLAALAGFRLLSSLRHHTGTTGTILLSSILVLSSMFFGSLHWGNHLCWEPGPIKGEVPHPVPLIPNPDLVLAQKYLSIRHGEEVERAGIQENDREGLIRARVAAVRHSRPLLLRTLDRHPDDRNSLLFTGWELVNSCPEDRIKVKDAWTLYLHRHPEDQEIRQVLFRVFGPRPGR